MQDAKNKRVIDPDEAVSDEYLSITRMEMYLRCGLQYQHRYGEGVKLPPAVAMVEGSCGHEALAFNNRHKVKKGDDLKPAVVQECFADTFSKMKKDIENWEGEKPDGVIKRGKTLLARYMATQAKNVRPELVEHEIKVDVAGVPMLGYLDVAGRINGIDSVVDYKFVGKPKTTNDVSSSIQLSFYGMWRLFEKPTMSRINVGFCSLVKSTNPHVKYEHVPLTEDRIRWFVYMVQAVQASIKKGIFNPCNPTDWCCSPRFCGYWRVCRGAIGKSF